MSLNSKKSWHPGKATNKAKVQKREEDEIEQRRKAEQRREELAAERAAARGDGAGESKLAWMYAQSRPARPPPSAHGAHGEGSLLVGARKIDAPTLAQKQAETRTARDAARKAEADPMAAVLAAQKSGHTRARSRGRGRVAKSRQQR